jgi:amino-acid N-acetyltransferase
VTAAEARTTNVTIVPASAEDHAEVLALLRDAGLPTEGVPGDLALLVVARDDTGAIAGCAGLERHADAVLLRSVAVASPRRGSGIGAELVSVALDRAREAGSTDAYLLTETAAAWFPRFGFVGLDRADVPEPLHESVEFRGACADSAVAMRLPLQAPSSRE